MTDWPADRVERWPIDRLVPCAQNARRHSDAQVDQIAAAIREWGWTNPVLVDEAGGIIAGHGRVLAAKRLGIADVPVMIASGWSEAQKRAYILADNRLAENAEWDGPTLEREAVGIAGLGFDLRLIGFGEGELKALTASDPELPIREVQTGTVEDRFWISLRGPLRLQADVLGRLKEMIEERPEVSLDVGVLSLEP